MLKRIETMVLMGIDMPVSAIRGQMASAIDIIVHLGRLADGRRRLMEIVEICGMEQGEVKTVPLFLVNESGNFEKKGELENRKKLKEYGQYENYQKLMEQI